MATTSAENPSLGLAPEEPAPPLAPLLAPEEPAQLPGLGLGDDLTASADQARGEALVALGGGPELMAIIPNPPTNKATTPFTTRGIPANFATAQFTAPGIYA